MSTRTKELRLALRALRVARRHVSQAINLNPMREYEERTLRAMMHRFGGEERRLVERIDHPSYPKG
jgi:hypothetical protein